MSQNNQLWLIRDNIIQYIIHNRHNTNITPKSTPLTTADKYLNKSQG